MQKKVDESYQAKIIAERKFWWEKSIKSKKVADARLDTRTLGFHAIVEQLKTNHSKEMTRMNNTMDGIENDMMDLEDEHSEAVHQLNSQLETQKELVHKEKQRRRRAEQNMTKAKAECREHLDSIKHYMINLEDELDVSVLSFIHFHLTLTLTCKYKSIFCLNTIANNVANERLRAIKILQCNLLSCRVIFQTSHMHEQQ